MNYWLDQLNITCNVVYKNGSRYKLEWLITGVTGYNMYLDVMNQEYEIKKNRKRTLSIA